MSCGLCPQESKYPVLNSKPALMRAFKKTTLKDGDGDAWVERKEFPALLRNLLYFNKLHAAFAAMDKGDDGRMDLAEFKAGLLHVGMSLGDAEAEAEFAAMDVNGGGQILFDEFCMWAAQRGCPVDDAVMAEFTVASTDMGAVEGG